MNYFFKIFLFFLFFSVFSYSAVVIDESMPSAGDGRSSVSCSNGMLPSLTPYSSTSNSRNMNMTDIPYGTWNQVESGETVSLVYYYYVDFYYGSNAHVSYFSEAYYCNVPLPTCPTGQEMFEGTCYETCGTDGLMVDGSCVERGTCRDGFDPFTSVDLYGNNATCTLEDGLGFSEVYQLFPEQTGSPVDCCGKLDSTEPIDPTVPTDTNSTGSEPNNINGEALAQLHTDNEINGVKLDEIKTVNELNGVKLDEIKTVNELNGVKLDEIKTVNELNGVKLDEIKSVNQVNGIRLDGIKSSNEINGVKIDTLHSDNSVTQDILNGINSQIVDAKDVLSSIKEEIKNSRNSDFNSSSDIKNAINNASESSRNESNQTRQAINDASNQAHQDQVANRGKYDDLIIGLRDVVEATDRIGGQANDNAQTAHDDATDIKDAVDSLNDGREESENDLQDTKDGISDAIESAGSNYSSVVDTFNGLLTSYSNTPPTFNGTGSSVFSTVVYGHSVVFDLAMFEQLRPYFDIIFILILAWINFKFYRWILEFLIKIGV